MSDLPKKYLICSVSELIEKGLAIRFQVELDGKRKPAFILKYGSQYFAYLNECAHIPVEMDWQPGDFLDIDKTTILCAMHGAAYLPDTGLCVRGPCKGARLKKIPIYEQEMQLVTDLPVFPDE